MELEHARGEAIASTIQGFDIDAMAITTRRIADDGFPVVGVTHDAEGDWQFLDGVSADPEDGMVVCLGCFIAQWPEVRALLDLPQGWEACLQLDGQWVRSEIHGKEESDESVGPSPNGLAVDNHQRLLYRSGSVIALSVVVTATWSFVVGILFTSLCTSNPGPWTAFFVLLMCIRCFRISVELAGERVVIKNYWRTRAIAPISDYEFVPCTQFVPGYGVGSAVSVLALRRIGQKKRYPMRASGDGYLRTELQNALLSRGLSMNRANT